MLYCDRAADHLSKVEAVGGSKERFADDFTFGLSEPFCSQNMSRLTKIADANGFEGLLSVVRQCSRLCTAHSPNQGVALATQGSI
jgi:hypothetical protein